MLVVSSASHDLISGDISLYQQHYLDVEGCSHSHVCGSDNYFTTFDDKIVVSADDKRIYVLQDLYLIVPLSVDSAHHDHTAENIGLVIVFCMLVDSGYITHTAEESGVFPWLFVNGSSHHHAAGSVLAGEVIPGILVGTIETWFESATEITLIGKS
jgi:hypothetical protein